MCAGKGHLLRVGPFIIARRYSYEALLNQLPADEAVMFADAVHPTHAVRARMLA